MADFCFDTVGLNCREKQQVSVSKLRRPGCSSVRKQLKTNGGRDRTRTSDLLRVNLSLSAYIADSFSGLLPPIRRVRVSTALIEQHSEQQFPCSTILISGLGSRFCSQRSFTTAILPR